MTQGNNLKKNETQKGTHTLLGDSGQWDFTVNTLHRLPLLPRYHMFLTLSYMHVNYTKDHGITDRN